MNIKFLASIALLLLVLSGCKKEDSQETIEQYLTRSNLMSTVTKDPRGFYYQIMTPGTGATPTLSSTVTVFYKGTFTNGSVFDETTGSPAKFGLGGSIIMGWKYGVPLIKTGGRIILYLPPSLGYGGSPYGPIPANSALIFDITLQSVQ